MGNMMSDAVRWMKHLELAQAANIGVENARNLVRRKRGQRKPDIDGTAHIAVPVEHLEKIKEASNAPINGKADTPTAPPMSALISLPADRGADGASVITKLSQHIGRLERQIEILRQERHGELQRALGRETLAVQVEALRAALDQAYRNRDRWAVQAHTLPY